MQNDGACTVWIFVKLEAEGARVQCKRRVSTWVYAFLCKGWTGSIRNRKQASLNSGCSEVASRVKRLQRFDTGM